MKNNVGLLLISLTMFACSYALSKVDAAEEEICADSVVPQGWITTDVYWQPAKCSQPYRIPNVAKIQRYDDKPVGTTMTVCSLAPTPGGWTQQDSYWQPALCGQPTSKSNNVKTIKRVS